jgi:hypothetical protein
LRDLKILMRLADELATMRLLENDWGEECLRKYHERIPKSAPEEDWDARNALYAMYVAIHDSALYPDSPHFRETSVILPEIA